MRFLLQIILCQLATATNLNIATVVVDGSIDDDSCLSKEIKLQEEIKKLRLSTKAIISRFGKVPQCGDGSWYQLVSFNMSVANSQCPDGWVEENERGVRACGRGTIRASCQSMFLNTDHQLKYANICGRTIGYQYGNSDAFGKSSGKTIDEIYVDGLSITYGSPRQHIWTYAAGLGDQPLGNQGYTCSNCPCSSDPGASSPSYIDDNWYCESGNPNLTVPWRLIFSNDPLWDGENCEGACCSNGKSPPWFSVELPGPTNDAIEAHICANEHSDTNEDVFIKIFEIYIQ